MDDGIDGIINNVIDHIMTDYVRERDEAVETLDLDTFKAFMSKWQARGLIPECFSLAADEILEVSIRKMALHIANVSEETREAAETWLLSRGYDLDLYE